MRETLERVGLQDRAGQVAGDLSYGHQRLLEVAMGLGQNPRLLILDEPTQGLTDGEVEAFICLIREVAETTTILLIEHNINVVMALAGRITVLNFGEVIADGTPKEIRENHCCPGGLLGRMMLEIQKLNAGYGSVQVLRDFSLAVDQGEILCLLGRNGAGKTTLMKAIMGLLPSLFRKGRTLEGRDISSLPALSRCRVAAWLTSLRDDGCSPQ